MGAHTKHHTELISEIIPLLFAGVLESCSTYVQKLSKQRFLLPESTQYSLVTRGYCMPTKYVPPTRVYKLIKLRQTMRQLGVSHLMNSLPSTLAWHIVSAASVLGCSTGDIMQGTKQPNWNAILAKQKGLKILLYETPESLSIFWTDIAHFRSISHSAAFQIKRRLQVLLRGH